MNRALALLALAPISGGIINPGFDQNPTPITKDGYLCENAFDEIVLCPIDIYGEITEIIFKVSFKNNLTSPATISLEIENSNYEMVFDTVEVNQRKQTIHYEYNNLYTAIGDVNAFIFTLNSQYGTDTRRMMGRRRQYQNISVTENGQINEVGQSVVYYERKNGTTTFIKEKYRFSGYSDLTYQPSSLPFDICDFYFKYESVNLYTPTFGNTYFLIRGIFASYYSEIGIPMGSSVRALSLTPHYDVKTTKVTFTLNEDLYVDPFTQKMSSKSKEGYIKTNKLYFPANIKDDAAFSFEYSLTECGANKVRISANMTTRIMQSALGNCFDSKYCISTNEAYPDVSLGERIVY